ncbi:IclR family transcriptional regulator [Enterovibrio norvegicus]|uniref:IclR family transcriptional regulator n=1 Tax=Enterovibrio norvegicus TaxID=188144 RepID=UPI0013D650C1|nr:IclR family transcriptional regulator [Enterovibrio norvegicus]
MTAEENQVKKYQAPALEKGLDILEILSSHSMGLTQVEIARELNRSVGEIFRMLVVLCERGYLSLDTVTDKYALTTKMFEISHRYPKIKRLTSLAAPVMNELAHKTDQSIHLTIFSDNSILVIGQVDAPGYHGLSVRLGAVLDVWKASSGRVILANSPQSLLDAYIAFNPPGDPTQIDAVTDELGKIKARGYEQCKSYVIKGVVNVSVPLFDYSGNAIACMTIPYIEMLDGQNQMPLRDCRKALLEAARYLSEQMGGNLAN